MPSKNYDFCNFCDFSKNCEKLQKSQFLLKLLNSSGKGRRNVPNKYRVGDALSMISMYEVNLMVFLYRFILHGIRPIAEIVGMFSTDLYVLRRKQGILAMIHGRHFVFFVIVQAQRLTNFCQ